MKILFVPVGVIVLVLTLSFIAWFLRRVMVKRSRKTEKNQNKPKKEETSEEKKPTESKQKVWMFKKHPVSLALVGGIVMLNWLTWALDESFWWTLWSNHGRFWAINFGLWLALVLLFVKSEDGKNTHPIIKKISKAILIMVSVIVLTAIYDIYKIKHPGPETAPASGSLSYNNVPADIALPIIAQCESGGKQFEDDGVTPLKNKQGSSAVGKYQILASDHEKRAQSMGFYIRTEAGNEGYARVLYGESGTKHWEADPKSKACWEPKLAALGYGQGLKNEAGIRFVEVKAPIEGFGGETIIPSGTYFDWGDSKDAFIVRDQKGSIARYDPDNSVLENLPYPSKSIAFKSLSEKPATVILKLGNKPF